MPLCHPVYLNYGGVYEDEESENHSIKNNV